MKPSLKRFLYWTPRILSIVYVLFVSMFALDVFDETRGFLETAIALAMHLIPSFVLVIVLVVSWRREWVGGVVYLLLAVLYVSTTWGRFHWSAYAFIGGPLVILGGLFIAGWIHRGELHAQH